MFSYIKNAIDKITISSSQWVFGENKFTRERKFSFNDYITFFTCNKGLSNRCDLEDYIEDSLNCDFSHYSRQALSKQRTFINPLVFKEINKQYLKEINYTGNNSFFEDFKGFRILAGDGSDFELPDFPEVRKEFKINDDSLNYRKAAMAKFSSIMDVLNGFLLDGIIGNFKNGELQLIQQNIQNIKDIIIPEKTIFIFDRGYNATALYAHIMSINSYFIVRLRDNVYKKERKYVKTNDSPIQIRLLERRLEKFDDLELKAKYEKEAYLNLRIVEFPLNNNTTEVLLTNLPKNMFKIEDLKELYRMRWGIETNYNTLKNRFYIENYTGKRRITIEQDIYSKFLRFNITKYMEKYLNLIINKVKRKKGIKNKYKVDQAHLIRKLKKYLPIMLLNPDKKIIRKYMKKLIDSCTQSPNKDIKHKSTTRNNKKARKFNMNYRLS